MYRDTELTDKEERVLEFLSRNPHTRLGDFAMRHGLRNIYVNEFPAILGSLERKGLVVSSRKTEYHSLKNVHRMMTGRRPEPTTTYWLTALGVQMAEASRREEELARASRD